MKGVATYALSVVLGRDIMVKLYSTLTKEEEFLEESVPNKNIKKIVLFAITGVAIGFFINELISFIIFLWGYFGC